MRLNLASTRLAFALIGLTLTFLVLSALIPQQGILQGQITDLREALGSGYRVIEILRLDQIYTTPYFYLTLGLLAVNLLFGNIARFRTVIRVERTLLKARHLGSIIFHLSLLLVIVSIIANYLYKYEGIFILTEGQRVRDNSASYYREYQGPLEAASYDRFGLRLEEVDLAYPVQNSFATAARITVWPTGSVFPDTGVVHTNRPLVVGDLQIHYGMTYGYTPELQIVDSLQQTIFKGFIRLSTRDELDKLVFHDFHVDQMSGLHIDMTVNDDDLVSPKIQLEISQSGEILGSGQIDIGSAISTHGWHISVPRLRRWCYLNVTENPWLDWVFTGFWMALVGMTVSFVPRVMPKRKANT